MRKFNRTEAKKGNSGDPLMDVAKAREILNIYTLEHGRDMAPDELDAHRMGVEALLEGGAAGMNGFTVQLDETEQKVLNATWPVSKHFIEMMAKIVIKMLLVFASQGEDKVAPYLDRIRSGESTEAVVRDMFQELGLFASLSSLDKGVPAEDEIRRALGWPQK